MSTIISNQDSSSGGGGIITLALPIASAIIRPGGASCTLTNLHKGDLLIIHFNTSITPSVTIASSAYQPLDLHTSMIWYGQTCISLSPDRDVAYRFIEDADSVQFGCNYNTDYTSYVSVIRPITGSLYLTGELSTASKTEVPLSFVDWATFNSSSSLTLLANQTSSSTKIYNHDNPGSSFKVSTYRIGITTGSQIYGAYPQWQCSDVITDLNSNMWIADRMDGVTNISTPNYSGVLYR